MRRRGGGGNNTTANQRLISALPIPSADVSSASRVWCVCPPFRLFLLFLVLCSPLDSGYMLSNFLPLVQTKDDSTPPLKPQHPSPRHSSLASLNRALFFWRELKTTVESGWGRRAGHDHPVDVLVRGGQRPGLEEARREALPGVG